MMAVNIANSLSHSIAKSHICVTRNEGALKSKIDAEVGYLFLNRKKTVDFRAIKRLKKYIRKHNISIIHAHSSSYFMAVLVKFSIPKVKVIWHDHYGKSEALNKRKKQPLKFFSRYFETSIVVNRKLFSWATSVLKQKSVEYLPNYAKFNKVEAKTSLNGVEGKRIVCVAGFRLQKDHLTLLGAFKNVNPDWTLHLVGNQYKDAYFENILEYIEANNLQEKVFIYHNVIDIEHILNQSTIGILSSQSEGLPVSLLEYGLAKLPVLVTNVGECASVVKNGENGYVVEKKNANVMAEKLSILISDEKKRTIFTSKFHNHVLEHYSEQNFIHRLLKIYHS